MIEIMLVAGDAGPTHVVVETDPRGMRKTLGNLPQHLVPQVIAELYRSLSFFQKKQALDLMYPNAKIVG